MECPQCRHANPSGTKFCGECGARLQTLCPACKAVNPPGNKFCGECGQPLGSGAPAPTAAPAAASEPPPPPAVASAPAPARYASPESYTPKHLAEKILTSRGAIEGERKGVTVMFSDVSGFTAMSEKLDPEDVHAIMDRAFEVILREVHRYEGTINQFLGDGVMALFGAPVAHEDHAHRALSAALAIQSGLEPLADEVRRTHGVEFRMRMGINTGLVVVGAIGKDLRMDYTAVGDATNLAARLLGIAKPGQIVVSRRTQHLREGLLRLRGPGRFRGQGEGRAGSRVCREQRDQRPNQAGGVEGARADPAGWPRSGARSRSPESTAGPPMARAPSRCSWATRGSANPACSTSSCAGIEAEGASSWRRPACPLAAPWRTARSWSCCGATSISSEGISGEGIRSRVAEQLQFLGLEGEERSILLAHFLGVSAPPEFLNRLSGPQLKERTLGVLRDVFLRASELAPLILIVENMHWIDSASEEFLAHLAAGLPGHRLLLVLTTRPGYAAPWLAPPLAETITLEGLGAGEVRGMVRTLLAAEEVSEQLFKILADKSEGNPLYVEEILRQLQETGGIDVENGEARVSRADVAVPATIHDIIAARIDRIADPLKQTLQGASVVGRRFGISLVSRVLEVAPDQVAARLRELHGLDFVFPSAQDPELMYSFKHALTQDVVYAGVLERRRRTYHAASGLGLEELYAGQPRRDRRGGRLSLRARAGVGQGRDLLPAGRGQGPAEVGAP